MRIHHKNLKVVQVDNSYFSTLNAGIPINPYRNKGGIGITDLNPSDHYARSVQYVRMEGSPEKHVPYRVLGSDDLLRISIDVVKAVFKDADNLIADYDVITYNSHLRDVSICEGAAYTVILHYANVWEKKLGYVIEPEMSGTDHKKAVLDISKIARCMDIIFNAGPKIFFDIVERKDFARVMDFITLHYAASFVEPSSLRRGKHINMPMIEAGIVKYSNCCNTTSIPYVELDDEAFKKIVGYLTSRARNKFRRVNT